MSGKKKRKQLTIEERWEILCRLETGATATSIGNEYGVTVSAVSRIKKNKVNILRYKKILDQCQASTARKKITGIENSRLDRCMHRWFMQKRCLDEPVSGADLKSKANQYNKVLNGPGSFKASSGWLEKFKGRYGVTDLSLDPQRFSADSEVSRNFYHEFNSYLKTNGYDEEHVYNATETSILWRMLPVRTFHSRLEGEKLSDDRVTIMACANATGTHKLPLMVIGKERDPECLQDTNINLVTYKSQENGWMDDKLFFEWYHKFFLPEVEERYKDTGEKCILLLDNAPPHASTQILNGLSNIVDVVYLPVSVTSTIQPMNCGIIYKIKREYKMSLLRRIMSADREQTLLDYMRSLTMLYCCEEIVEAWKSVTATDVAKAWRYIFRRKNVPACRRERMDSRLLLELLQRISEGGQITAEEKDMWLLDNKDPGWKILTDDDILFNDVRCLEENIKKEKIEETTIPDDDITLPLPMDHDQESTPSVSEALIGCNYLEAWIQSRSECTQHQLAVLRQLRELALDVTLTEKLSSRKK